MSKASSVVALALNEIGYREKASNASLDLATANAGTANWTKYARDLWNAGYYNGNKNGYAWCDVFVDWLFFKVFGKTEGQLLECQTGDLGAACPYSAGYYKAQGRYDKNPKYGDQIFFQQGGELVHTGIVVEVTATQVITVEGNSSNMVKKNTYSRSSSYIAGYGHPKYTEESEPAASGGTEVIDVGEEVTVKLNKIGKGSSGALVKTAQRILYARGIRDDAGGTISVDGDFGAKTAQATVKLQKQLFPGDPSQWDGVWGSNTWQAALTKLW
jgi:hypothetical protein